MNCNILFVWKTFLTHGTFESVLDATFKSHVSVQIIIPVVGLATLAALEGLLRGLLLALVVGGRAGPGPGLWLGWAGQLQSEGLGARGEREGGGGGGGGGRGS